MHTGTVIWMNPVRLSRKGALWEEREYLILNVRQSNKKTYSEMEGSDVPVLACVQLHALYYFHVVHGTTPSTEAGGT
jgi:hypothetical protein